MTNLLLPYTYVGCQLACAMTTIFDSPKLRRGNTETLKAWKALRLD